MSKVSDWIQKEHEEHQKVLQETDEDAHTHVLFLRQLEYKQRFIKTHFPDSPTRKKMLGLVQELRQLTSKALEHKE